MPALALTLGSFLLILLLVRLRVPLALAILSGAVAAGLGFGLTVQAVLVGMVRGATQPLALGVAATVILLLATSRLMQSSGQMQRIVDLACRVLRRPAVTMAALPALIGLLPMPGGAVFSAPMVASVSGSNQLRGELLSAINYWYRHIWEHWWPLYPGVILAMTLTGIDLPAFVAVQLPLGVAMACAGLLLFRTTPREPRGGTAPATTGARWQLVRETSTIWVILLGWGAASLALRAAAAGGLALPSWFGRFGPILLALVAGLVWTACRGRLRAPEVLRALGQWSVLSLAGLVVAIMIYQHILEQAQVAPRIAAEMAASGLPLLVVVVLLPAVAGLITGVAFGFVGTSFPIILGLLAALPDAPPILPYVVLAYACGHLGMMASPIHLCLVVSNRYFATSYWRVYRHLVVPSLLLGFAVAVYFVALKALT